MSTSDTINIFIAFGTCTAVAVALLVKGQNSFENTFNLLLAQHNEALRKLKEHKEYTPKTNKLFDLKGNFDLASLNANMHKMDDFFGSYFRVLYHILKHIDRSAGYHRFDFKEKKRYTSLVRSFLDNETVLLLAINCAHAKIHNQYYNYKNLIERYAFFEHLILDPEKFLEYMRFNNNNLAETYEKICAIENGAHEKLIEEIKAAYHVSAFGNHEV